MIAALQRRSTRTQPTHAARRAARCRRPAFQLRRQRRGTSGRPLRAMLACLHALILAMLEFPVPILVAVQGQCLGGGLEVALAGGPIFASPDAQFGQPEIKLGVFAPAASVLLPYRVNQPPPRTCCSRAARSTPSRPRRWAWCTRSAPIRRPPRSPTSNSTWPRSGAALHCAVTAARAPMRADVRRRLAEVEALYLDPLMQTRDANEGLAAFLARNVHPPGSTADEHDHNVADGGHRRALPGALRRPRLQRRQGMEGGRARPQGDRLHAGLRAARADPRRRHAAGGHPRRRRSARSDPGRRLLPELHLPHSRARPSNSG